MLRVTLAAALLGTPYVANAAYQGYAAQALDS